MVPTSLPLAKDAVAVIFNNASCDTALTVSELRGILTGKFRKKYTVVFDNQGSSTLRFMTDSILKGTPLGANVFAAKGNDSVLAYVANNPDAIGFVGVSTVSDFNDPEELAFIKTVRVAEIYNDKLQKFYKPYQAYIAPDYYPLTRVVYYVNREAYPGLGTGFANFLTRERGQLIFKQARLFPLRTNIIFRDAAVNSQ
jgi:phosphate transport system substrate-binding protein